MIYKLLVNNTDVKSGKSQDLGHARTIDLQMFLPGAMYPKNFLGSG